eukprot:1916359-Pleurochrysis_carterae.AAC.2
MPPSARRLLRPARNPVKRPEDVAAVERRHKPLRVPNLRKSALHIRQQAREPANLRVAEAVATDDPRCRVSDLPEPAVGPAARFGPAHTDSLFEKVPEQRRRCSDLGFVSGGRHHRVAVCMQVLEQLRVVGGETRRALRTEAGTVLTPRAYVRRCLRAVARGTLPLLSRVVSHSAGGAEGTARGDVGERVAERVGERAGDRVRDRVRERAREGKREGVGAGSSANDGESEGLDEAGGAETSLASSRLHSLALSS